MKYANRSVTNIDSVYARYLAKIADITTKRDQLAGDIKAELDAAAFGNQPVDEGGEDGLGRRSKALIERVEDLAEREDRAERDDRDRH
jgi:hypothetical protein